jgi:hypothetical protein
MERLRVADFIEEMEIEGSVHAAIRGLQFTVGPVNPELRIDVDRHLFGSAVSNLLQNAFKFTRPSGHVWLRTQSTQHSVSIEVEDECGGLISGTAETIFQPFEQRRSDRSGLGLGLTISRQAIEADGGRLSVRDMPGKGCVFLVEMPRAGPRSAADPRRAPGGSARLLHSGASVPVGSSGHRGRRGDAAQHAGEHQAVERKQGIPVEQPPEPERIEDRGLSDARAPAVGSTSNWSHARPGSRISAASLSSCGGSNASTRQKSSASPDATHAGHAGRGAVQVRRPASRARRESSTAALP